MRNKLLPHCKSAVAGGSEPLSARQLLVVWNRRQPVTDQRLDSGCHAICNPILAEIDVQTEKFERDQFSLAL